MRSQDTQTEAPAYRTVETQVELENLSPYSISEPKIKYEPNAIHGSNHFTESISKNKKRKLMNEENNYDNNNDKLKNQ